MKRLKQVVMGLVWCVVSVGLSKSALADWKMSTEHEVNSDGASISKQYMYLDETDIKACQVITDNINDLDKYNIPWECGMPISANNYLLSKPEWVEVTGEEKIRALESLYKSKPGVTPSVPLDEENRPVYSYPFDVDGVAGDEKIYLRTSATNEHPCIPGYRSRSSLWFAENDGSSLFKRLGAQSTQSTMDTDIVRFSNRIYMTSYVHDKSVPGEFTIYTYSNNPDFPKARYKARKTVCTINLASPASLEIKEKLP